MFKCNYLVFLFLITICARITNGWHGYYADSTVETDCGPYGFTCEPNNRVRLCEGIKIIGPAFICPRGTICNEQSTSVCEDAINYIDPSLTRKLRCSRNERVANPNVPGCKGYILCVLSGNRIQHINFRCSGDTIFNGFSRTCTSPNRYKCPLANTTRQEFYPTENPNKHDSSGHHHRPTSIECKNYKFKVTQNGSPGQATYFCPPRPIVGQERIRCTIFSNDFCVTLEKEMTDQYITDSAPYRKPRM